MLKKALLFFTLLIFFSCKENIQQPKEDYKKPALSVAKKYAKPVALDNFSNSSVKNWKEYKDLDEFLTRFENISANEALNNAVEFNGLVKSLKDSIKPNILNNDAFNARVNVLENESLRLVDMTKIPAITADEVDMQVAKTLSVFNSINEKINTIFKQKRFEDAVKIDGDFFGLDTTETKEKEIVKSTSLKNKKPNSNLNSEIPKRKTKDKKKTNSLSNMLKDEK